MDTFCSNLGEKEAVKQDKPDRPEMHVVPVSCPHLPSLHCHSSKSAFYAVGQAGCVEGCTQLCSHSMWDMHRSMHPDSSGEKI